jgi:hypothetical protein
MEDEILEETLDATKSLTGRAVTVGVVAVAVGAVAYFGKKAFRRYQDSRVEQVVPPADEDSEIMQDILRAKELIAEANEVAIAHGIPTTDAYVDPIPPGNDPGNYTSVDEFKAEVVDVLKAEMVNTIMGMTEEQLDSALMSRVEVPEEAETHSIFAEVEWDHAQVAKERKGKDVYVLHEDEFFQDERGYTQDTLMYYSGDYTLADPHDRPIYNSTEVLGTDFMNQFGQGTNQEDVLYIRNETLKAEYEVVLAGGSYAEEILGVDASDEDRPVKRVARSKDWEEQ